MMSIGMSFLDVSKMGASNLIQESKSRNTGKKIRSHTDRLKIKDDHLDLFLKRPVNLVSIERFCYEIINEYENPFGNRYSLAHFKKCLVNQAKDYQLKSE